MFCLYLYVHPICLAVYPLCAVVAYYDQVFCERMRKKYFKDVEYLDYSHWYVADDEIKDVYQLNYKGATILTNERSRDVWDLNKSIFFMFIRRIFKIVMKEYRT